MLGARTLLIISAQNGLHIGEQNAPENSAVTPLFNLMHWPASFPSKFFFSSFFFQIEFYLIEALSV